MNQLTQNHCFCEIREMRNANAVKKKKPNLELQTQAIRIDNRSLKQDSGDSANCSPALDACFIKAAICCCDNFNQNKSFQSHLFI